MGEPKRFALLNIRMPFKKHPDIFEKLLEVFCFFKKFYALNQVLGIMKAALSAYSQYLLSKYRFFNHTLKAITSGVRSRAVR